MPSKMSLNASWSMAVGGMVGGGIFSVLGVVVATAGAWAWLSFLAAGLVALISAHSYSQLAIRYGKGGGAFTYLRETGHETSAGSLAWLLILGYILTISIYAFTFGEYVAHVLAIGAWLPRVLALIVIALFTAVNLRGIGDIAAVEIVTVYGKLAVLIGLALFGLFEWDSSQLDAGSGSTSWTSALLGAAVIFMAHEGFQLLSYDYEDLRERDRTLPRATLLAVLTVIVVYILVALGATMLVGPQTLIEHQEVALSIAGQAALGILGLLLVTVAAAFSTGSAINATLFSTSRLMEYVSREGDLPRAFAHENQARIPDVAILVIGGTAALLASVGHLASLVETASLIFLITFGAVNVIAFRERIAGRWFALLGAVFCGLAVAIATVYQFQRAPWSVAGALVTLVLVLWLRWYKAHRAAHG